MLYHVAIFLMTVTLVCPQMLGLRPRLTIRGLMWLVLVFAFAFASLCQPRAGNGAMDALVLLFGFAFAGLAWR